MASCRDVSAHPPSSHSEPNQIKQNKNRPYHTTSDQNITISANTTMCQETSILYACGHHSPHAYSLCPSGIAAVAARSAATTFGSVYSPLNAISEADIVRLCPGAKKGKEKVVVMDKQCERCQNVRWGPYGERAGSPWEFPEFPRFPELPMNNPYYPGPFYSQRRRPTKKEEKGGKKDEQKREKGAWTRRQGRTRMRR